MKIIGLHVVYRFLELIRQPTYVVTTVLFPSMFFWFFAVPHATGPVEAQLLMASFASFGVLGVVLFQFGVGWAQERVSPWSLYLRTLPLRSREILISQVVVGFLFSVLAVAGVVGTAHLAVTVGLPVERWLPSLLTILAGGLPFASLGMLIGVACSPRAAVPVANLIYLPLSFAGGLWIPPNALPQVIQNISEYLPTRMYAEVVWAVTLNHSIKMRNVYGLLIYLVLFFLLAVYFHQRDEGERYN